ncbi:MAG: hypothetical protein HC852_13900 [Acaryochloridaceae cyanobacterium RU_4_10]|nr:hypothetical protein [Acaryochloridaceae cyanobacterium RU_4_10]
MTISKQGMLIVHAIALTIVLVLVMSWQAQMQQGQPDRTPARQANAGILLQVVALIPN